MSMSLSILFTSLAVAFDVFMRAQIAVKSFIQLLNATIQELHSGAVWMS